MIESTARPQRHVLDRGWAIVAAANYSARALARERLRSIGFRVKEFHDGIQALAWIGEHHEIVEVAIIDRSLARMNGLALARTVQSLCYWAAVIMLRHDDSPMTMTMLKANGIRSSLPSDAESQVFVRTVETALATVHRSPFAYGSSANSELSSSCLRADFSKRYT